MTIDPGTDKFARASQLVGFVRATDRALRVLEQHDMIGHPVYRDLLLVLARADEDMAAQPVPAVEDQS